MRLPTKADELDTADDLPYPIETIRYWYISPFGGRSRELTSDQVGLNREALTRNTELEPEDWVTVALVGNTPERPWFFQHRYEVVALDARKPGAGELSPRGEVVLPQQAFDFVKRPHLQPRVGDAVVLKGTAAKRLIGSPDWLKELLGNSLRRPDF